MFRSVCYLPVIFLSTSLLVAQDSPAEKLIRQAIFDLQTGRGKLSDPVEQAKVDQAIRELEGVTSGESKPAAPSFEVKPALLKKKFGATKAFFNKKTGELTLVYEFGGKPNLSDFEITTQKVAIARKTLYMEGAETLTHKAKWRSFQVETNIQFKTMDQIGIASTNGLQLNSEGNNPDTLYLFDVGDGKAQKVIKAQQVVPERLRSGSTQIGFSITPNKASVHWGSEQLSVPIVAEDDIHQIMLMSGVGGCGFSNLVIVGIPDPQWLQEFLSE